jgi:hypothetical protein
MTKKSIALWNSASIGCFLLSLFFITACSDDQTNSKIIVAPTRIQQEQKNLGLDKSPMDMQYYPVDYPVAKMSGNVKEPLVARVIYSRPKRDHRIIFGEIVKYGSPWRLGANEATEIEFFKDVIIANQRIQKGKYILYCIPYKDKWKLILNNDLYTWGLKIDSSKDAHSFEVPVQEVKNPIEVFTMGFAKSKTGFELLMAWDVVKVSLPIKA